MKAFSLLAFLLLMVSCSPPDYEMTTDDFEWLYNQVSEADPPEHQIIEKELPQPCRIISANGKFQVLREGEDYYFLVKTKIGAKDNFEGWFWFAQPPTEEQIRGEGEGMMISVEGYRLFDELYVTEKKSLGLYKVKFDLN